MYNMNYSIFRFTLNMHSHRSQASIPVKKFDTAVRFYITITDGGLPYTIEDGCMAVFRGKKADDSVLVNYCRIENGIVVYDFTEQTTSCTGIINCQIDLIGIGGRKIASPTFVIVVDDNVVYDKDIITSQSERNVLEGMVASAENAEFYAGVSEDNSEYAYGSALKAEGYALGTHGGYVVDSTSPYHENNAKYYAESASANELASRQNMDTATSKAEDAKDSAEMAEEFAQDARNSANEAIDACNEAKGYVDALKVDRVTDIKLGYDKTTHQVAISLWGVKSDGSEGVIGTTEDFDLPLESVVVDGRYDKEAEEVVLTLQNGNEIRFTVPTLVDGLVLQADFNAHIQEYEKLEALHWEHILELGEIKTSVKVDGKFVSEFDADTKVDKTTLAGTGGTEKAGLVYTPNGNWNGINAVNGVLTLAPASKSQIEERKANFAITPSNLDYAVNSVVSKDISDHEKRIENLESALLTYAEDTTKAYEKVVPEGVGNYALLNSIGGASYASKNLYNPNGSQFAVNEDGSIHIVTEASFDIATRVTLPSITLNAGTYYVSYKTNPYISIDALYFHFDDGEQEANPTTLTLDKTTTIYVDMDFDGTGFTEGEAVFDLYVMVSKENIPFEPYFEGLRNAKTTAFVSKDKSGNALDTYNIPQGIQDQENYGKEYTYVDFDNKQFVDNSHTIVLTGTEPVSIYDYNGVYIGNSNQYPYGPNGSGATDTPYVSNAVTQAWVARYGQLWWLNALSTYGFNDHIVDKTNITYDEKVIARDRLIEYLAKRYAEGNPVVVTYRVGEGKTTGISQHLTDYEDFKEFKCKANGTLIFENEHELAVPSTLTYVKERK